MLDTCVSPGTTKNGGRRARVAGRKPEIKKLFKGPSDTAGDVR
jgi:hypothetical protein